MKKLKLDIQKFADEPTYYQSGVLIDEEGLYEYHTKMKEYAQKKITSTNKLDYSLLSNTPTIPTVPTNVSAFTNDAGYLTSETDPVFTASASAGITSTDISNWDAKQEALVSGTNIKTINNQSLLGSGNITIQSGGGGTATDVQINGSSIVSNDVANLSVEGTYNASTNKIATMSEIPTKTSDLTNDSNFAVTNANNNFSSSQSITGDLTVSGTAQIQNGLYCKPTGQANTPVGNSMLVIKRVTNSEAPNNGVILEFGNSTSWVGQLYIGDNATQGIYYNGWSNGTRGSWRRLADAPVSLYDNASGTTGNITLSETSANFTYIEIYYHSDNEYKCEKVYQPNGKAVTLTSQTLDTATPMIYGKTKKITFSGTSLTVNNYSQYTIRNNSTGYVQVSDNRNTIYIVRVVGYR